MPIRRSLFVILAALLFLHQPLSASTTIPFEFRDGMIWLKVAVAGQSEPLHFLLDSGAGTSVIDLASARRLGLKLGRSVTALGAGGRANAYQVAGFEGRVEEVAVPSSLLALDLSGVSRTCCRHIDGLIGADFLREHIVRIDFAAQTIHLPSRAESESVGAEILPLEQRNDTWCARISVDGNAPEWLRLDTGCSTALEWVTRGQGAGKIRTDVQLGSLHLTSIPTGLHTAAMFAGESGLIGNGLLSRFTVTIDAAQHRCLLASR